MKLLIITQKVDRDDPVLGFFLGWITELARRCDQVTVICLWRGDHDLPANVRVLSLGKDEIPAAAAFSPRAKLVYLSRFFKYIWVYRREYGAVFIHMNQIYTILGGPFWRLWDKKVSLWYAHGKVSTSLRVAALFAKVIFTSTPEGCRVASRKIKIVGQGIDVKRFIPSGEAVASGRRSLFRIITVGRISRVKDYETLIEAVAGLASDLQRAVEVSIVGGASLTDEQAYQSELVDLIKARGVEDVVKLLGPVASERVVNYLQEADLFVSMSHTGSLDKVILEAMAVGLPVLTCNDAMAGVLGARTAELTFAKSSVADLAAKLQDIIRKQPDERTRLGQELRQIVVRHHSLPGLIDKIITELIKP